MRFVKKIPKDSGWNNILAKQTNKGVSRVKLSRTRLHDSESQAKYHADSLGEVLGTYSEEKLYRPDGTMKPYRVEEASLEDQNSRDS